MVKMLGPFWIQMLTVPPSLIICGWMFKHWFPKMNHNFIPILLLCIGLISCLTIPGSYNTVADILIGTVIASSAIGIHQIGRAIINLFKYYKTTRRGELPIINVSNHKEEFEDE